MKEVLRKNWAIRLNGNNMEFRRQVKLRQNISPYLGFRVHLFWVFCFRRHIRFSRKSTILTNWKYKQKKEQYGAEFEKNNANKKRAIIRLSLLIHKRCIYWLARPVVCFRSRGNLPVNPRTSLFLITNFLRSIITPWCELLFTWCMQNQIKEPINMNFYFNDQTKNNNEN